MNPKEIQELARKIGFGTVSIINNPPYVLWIEKVATTERKTVFIRTVRALRDENVEQQWLIYGFIGFLKIPLKNLPTILEFKHKIRS